MCVVKILSLARRIEDCLGSKLFCNAEIAKGYCLFLVLILIVWCSEWLLQLNNACYDGTSVAP